MAANTGTQAEVVRLLNELKRAFLSGGPASIAAARAALTAALAAYDA
jgi:hypothetical protein